MSVTRNQLLSRKRDLYTAIRLLDGDREDGSIDEASYRSTRARYEREAADIVERLDALPDLPEEPARVERVVTGSTRGPYRYVLAVALGLLGLALALFLIAGLRSRGAGESITGSQPGVASTPVPLVSAAVRSAEARVREQPRNAGARIGLGNAYLNAGQAAAADQSYRQAMALDPRQPEAATLHAMVLGSTGRSPQAVALLRRIEATHPRFARAWLMEGIVLAQNRRGYSGAVAAWKRFLELDPHSPVASQVNRMIANTEKAERASP